MTTSEHATRFLADLAVGHSPRTVATYAVALRAFGALVGDPPIEDLDEGHLLDFARRLGAEGASRARLHTYTAAAVSLFGYLVREQIRPDLRLDRARARLRELRGRRPGVLPRVPADAVLAALIAAARAVEPSPDPHAERARLRDVAILETLRGTGVRAHELVGLRRGDLRPDRSAIVTGKGSKQRLVLFTRAAAEATLAYLAARADESQDLYLRHDAPARKRPLPLTTEGVRAVVARLSGPAGVRGLGVTPHRFRAWFATHLVAATGDLAAAQDLLGHASADTTRVYAKVTPGRLSAVHAAAFDGD